MIISKNDRGRWQAGDDEYTCGDVVEVLAFGQWLRGRIEATPKLGYFLLDPKSGAVLQLRDGLDARRPSAAPAEAHR
jgi:hypothetical protein